MQTRSGAEIRQWGYGFAQQCECHEPSSTGRQKKWAEQREERGFDDTETWALGDVIAAFILPRLKRFKELNNGYPGGMTFESWQAIIQEMIDGFECNEMRYGSDNTYDHDKVVRAFDLLAKYWNDIWW